MTAREVDRRSNLPHREFVRSYLDALKPVVLTEAVEGWAALEKWTPAYFREHWGHREVLVRGGPRHKNSEDRTYRLSELVELVLKSSAREPAPYLYACKIHERFPELLSDISPPLRYALPDRLRSRFLPGDRRHPEGLMELLIGGTGTRFPQIHYDSHHVHAWVTQVYGEKEFFLWPPDQGSCLYPMEEHPNKSEIGDVENLDIERFPRFAESHPFRTIVGAGETIFVPAGWWHTTRLITNSIAVSLNTVSASNWGQFSADIWAWERDARPLRWVLKRAYMVGAGMALSIAELRSTFL
jgi:Cupin-like domain